MSNCNKRNRDVNTLLLILPVPFRHSEAQSKDFPSAMIHQAGEALQS